MNTDDIQDLERQAKEKAEQLQAKIALMDRYAQSIGRDRWYNRGCLDITTLRLEMEALQARIRAAGGEV